MKELKRMKKFSSSFIDKNKNKKISKIKDKKERLEILKHTLVSELKLRQLNLDLKLKRLKDKKIRQILTVKSSIINSKILLLRADFNEKDFKKINSLLNKLEEEISNV